MIEIPSFCRYDAHVAFGRDTLNAKSLRLRGMGMGPSADSANPTVDAALVTPECLLADGEGVILAVKPSGWFVLLTSLPVMLVAAILTAAAYAAGDVFPPAIPRPMIGALCLAAASFRVMAACFQWLGRLYVLTDRRVMRVQGIRRVDVASCPLKKVRRTALSASTGERMLGLGCLDFQRDDGDASDLAWTHLARPAEIEEIVNQAIRRARRE